MSKHQPIYEVCCSCSQNLKMAWFTNNEFNGFPLANAKWIKLLVCHDNVLCCGVSLPLRWWYSTGGHYWFSFIIIFMGYMDPWVIISFSLYFSFKYLYYSTMLFHVYYSRKNTSIILQGLEYMWWGRLHWSLSHSWCVLITLLMMKVHGKDWRATINKHPIAILR